MSVGPIPDCSEDAMETRLLETPPPGITDFYELPYESVDRSHQHIDRCRRIRVGPALTFVFENQQTLWFRMQELAGVSRSTADADVRRLADWYSRLMPSQNRLLAAIWVGESGRRPYLNIDNLRDVVAESRLVLRSGAGYEIAATLLPQRVRDHLIGLVGWIEFPFTDDDRRALDTPRREWRLVIESDDYSHESEPLSPAVLMSLLADLGLAE